MTSLVSIRLNDHIFQEMRSNAHILNLSQTDYIRTAIKRMNNEIEEQARKTQLQQSSLRVREESMKVNAEFSEIEDDSET